MNIYAQAALDYAVLFVAVTATMYCAWRAMGPTLICQNCGRPSSLCKCSGSLDRASMTGIS
jgi:hypothetical protein